MDKPADVEYTVVLVFSGWGTERENAEQIIEEALEYLNTPRYEPGFRFAPNVTARLEIVPDIEDAQAKLETDDTVAIMILHDVPDEERRAFIRECAEHGVQVCQTTPVPDQPERPRRPRGQRRRLEFVLKKHNDNEPSAHTIPEPTLSASLDDDEEVLVERVQQLIAVLALGVMQFHWARQPPRIRWSE
jgi:hypothetical protein